MGTIITSSSNFLECVGNSPFIEGIYPEGIGQVLIGQFGLDQGRFTVNVHVYTKPAKEIPKWGLWGKNYNVVVLEFLGDGLKNIIIDNWEGFGRAELLCRKEGCLFSLSQKAVDWEFEVSFGILAFQKSSVYIDERWLG